MIKLSVRYLTGLRTTGSPQNLDSALSPETWKKLGDVLMQEVAFGDKNVVDLFRTWGTLYDVIAKLATGRDKKEHPSSDESEGEDSEGSAADDELSEGGLTQDSLSSTLAPSPTPDWGTRRGSYPSPRNYVPSRCSAPVEELECPLPFVPPSSPPPPCHSRPSSHLFRVLY